MLKICRMCKTEYPNTTEYFYLDKSRKDGIDNICKTCNAIKCRQYRELHRESCLNTRAQYHIKHKEIDNERNKKWRMENPKRCAIKNAVKVQRRRARAKMVAATLTTKQWTSVLEKFNHKCCYCGQEGRLTQDHFVPLSLGGEYTVGNILPACFSCNTNKSNKNALLWFRSQEFYSAKREMKILKYLNYKDGLQQLNILTDI